MLKIVILLSAILTQIYLDEPPEMDSIPLAFPDSQAELVYENNRAIITVDFYEFFGKISISHQNRPELPKLLRDLFLCDSMLHIKDLDVEAIDEEGQLILGTHLPNPDSLILNDSALCTYKREDGSSFRESNTSLNHELMKILELFLYRGRAKVYDKANEEYIQWISSRDVFSQGNIIAFRGYFFPNGELFLRRLKYVVPKEHRQ